MSRLSLLLLGLALAGLPQGAPAWGSIGHGVVAEIAARELTPAAKAEVERLLGDRAANAMREAADWAEVDRDWPGYGNTASLHYVNFPRGGDCSYRPARDCRGGRCVVAAIERFARELRESRDDGVRRSALRWLIHLVADVHQPLHAGYRDDRGGNAVQLRYRGRGTNLHLLLDAGLLGQRGLPAVAYADALLASPPEGARAVPEAWDQEAPARWAAESCTLVDGINPGPAGIDVAYERRVLATLEARLVLAGHRLAATMNAALDPR